MKKDNFGVRLVQFGLIFIDSPSTQTSVFALDKQQHKICIAGIDAPEKAQPFGNRSKQNMERMAHGKEALADNPKVDRYGRRVCKVWVLHADCPTCGKTLDVGLAQVSAG